MNNIINKSYKNLSGIYIITSPIGKIYIGQSNNIYDRFIRYKGLRCKGQKYLYNSFLKYGFDSHELNVLELCSSDKLNELEIYYINKYSSVDRSVGMNISYGGNNSKHSEESKTLIRLNSPRRKEFYAERNGMVTKFNSMNEAEKILKVTRKSIRESLSNPDKKVGKYSYSYEYPIEISCNRNIRGSRPDYVKEKISMNHKCKKKIIAEYNGETFYFNTIREASEKLGDSKKVIRFAINNPSKTKSKYKYKLQ